MANQVQVKQEVIPSYCATELSENDAVIKQEENDDYENYVHIQEIKQEKFDDQALDYGNFVFGV